MNDYMIDCENWEVEAYEAATGEDVAQELNFEEDAQ